MLLCGASGIGKTAGKGHKGQGARGSVRLGFEGGQTPLYLRTPKVGFNGRARRLRLGASLACVCGREELPSLTRGHGARRRTSQ